MGTFEKQPFFVGRGDTFELSFFRCPNCGHWSWDSEWNEVRVDGAVGDGIVVEWSCPVCHVSSSAQYSDDKAHREFDVLTLVVEPEITIHAGMVRVSYTGDRNRDDEFVLMLGPLTIKYDVIAEYVPSDGDIRRKRLRAGPLLSATDANLTVVFDEAVKEIIGDEEDEQ